MQELGVLYELKTPPFPPWVYVKPFPSLNPLGDVPIMIDESLVMTESAGIWKYLCALSAPTPMNAETSEAAFGPCMNYLHFGAATLTFPQTLVLRYAHFEPDERKQPQVAADYQKWFLSRLRALEPVLSDSPYLCTGRFTAADVLVGYARLSTVIAMIELERMVDPTARVAYIIEMMFHELLHPRMGPLLSLSQTELGELT